MYVAHILNAIIDIFTCSHCRWQWKGLNWEGYGHFPQENLHLLCSLLWPVWLPHHWEWTWVGAERVEVMVCVELGLGLYTPACQDSNLSLCHCTVGAGPLLAEMEGSRWFLCLCMAALIMGSLCVYECIWEYAYESKIDVRPRMNCAV